MTQHLHCHQSITECIEQLFTQDLLLIIAFVDAKVIS